MSLKKKTLTALTLLTLAVSGIGVSAAPPKTHAAYTITDLGTLGGRESDAFCINDKGQITGQSELRDNKSLHAFVTVKGTMQRIGEAAGTGWAINNSGQVAGYMGESGQAGHAFLDTKGAIVDLGTLGGEFSIGLSVNNPGQVAGYSSLPDNKFEHEHAFLYSNGKMMDIGTLGGMESLGYGINDNGQITGYSTLADSNIDHAFLYSSGKMHDLGTVVGGRDSLGYAINSGGQITGYSVMTDNEARHAFLYSNGKMRDLGTLGGRHSYGRSLNDNGVVVGWSDTAHQSAYHCHAFLYANGVMRDLNTVTPRNTGWTLQFAHGINNKGQIVGMGLIHGHIHGYLLTPIKAVSKS